MWGGLKMNKGLLFLCLLLSLSFGFVETVDAVVAVVEDEVVLNSDVLRQALYLSSQKNINPYDNKEAFDLIYEDVLDLLVDNLVDKLVFGHNSTRKWTEILYFTHNMDKIENFCPFSTRILTKNSFSTKL